MAIKRETLSDKVIDHLDGIDLSIKVSEILIKYQVSEDLSGKICKIIEGENEQEEIFDETLLAQIPEKLQEVTGLDQARAKQLAVELTTAWLLPVEEDVGQVAKLIRQWGGKVSDAKSVGRIVADVIKESGINFEDERLEKRLVFLLESLVRGVRTETDTLRAMARGTKVGGLDLPEEKAKPIVQAILDRINQEKKSQPETAPVKQPPKRVLPELPKKPVFDATMISDEDEIEVKQANKKIIVPKNPLTTEQGISQVLQSAKEIVKDEADIKRLQTIVNSRLREVRDAWQTKDTLEQDKDKGGLGLRGGQLVTVVEAIELAYDQTHLPIVKTSEEQKGKYIQEQDRAKIRKVEEQESELTKRYTKLTGRSTEANPQPAKVAFSPASPTAGQQSMQDISQVKRLIGPVEELANMDLISWRRLSKDPQESALKIKDKIELLESESLKKRLEGIKAWQSCPINQMYVEMTRQVLITGKSIDQIILDKTRDKQPTLTKEEVQVIMHLNNQLRF
ncbi:MAG: hypothetical protein V1695_00950 [Candidatus Uhrbacteria bacterium]